MCPGQEQNTVLESYPLRIVLLANAMSLGIYVLGAAILYPLRPWLSLAYVAFCLFLEIRLLATHCPDCAYFGKACFTGKGKVSSLFFKRGDPSRFAARQVQPVDFLPDIMVFLFPAIAAVVLMIHCFHWETLVLLLGLAALAFPGNNYVRGKHACCHCRQRELGCPAQQYFARINAGKTEHP